VGEAILSVVMAGLVPAIHVFSFCNKEVVDARVKPGHDEVKVRKQMVSETLPDSIAIYQAAKHFISANPL
jgi:hypothetical protein